MGALAASPVSVAVTEVDVLDIEVGEEGINDVIVVVEVECELIELLELPLFELLPAKVLAEVL